MKHTDLGLPSDVGLEELILGAAMLDSESAALVAAIDPECFSLEKHRRIWRAIDALQEAGSPVDIITVAQHLQVAGQLESVDGMSYLVHLDDNLPKVHAIEEYILRLRVIGGARRAALTLHRATQDVLNGDMEAVARAQDALATLTAPVKGKGLKRLGEFLQETGGVEAFLRPARESGVPVPWPSLAETLSQLAAGSLTILGAPPGMGKSQVACQWALHAARCGKPVGVFSLEMATAELWRRMVALEAGEAPDGVRRHRVGQAPLSRVAELPISVHDGMEQTISSLRAAVRAATRACRLDLVVVDYLQLVEAKGTNRTEAVGAISRGLKMLARECGVAVLALSQINREAQKAEDDRPPRLTDLRESGSIEQDADNVLFLYQARRDRAVMFESKCPMPVEVIVAKQRNGPAGARVKLVWNFGLARVEEQANFGSYGREIA